MADAFWRRAARRIRRKLYGYLAAEVVATARAAAAESAATLRAELAAEQGGMRDRSAALDTAMQVLRRDLATDHAGADARLVEIEARVGAMGAQLGAGESATHARLVEIEARVGAMGAQLGAGESATHARLAEIERAAGALRERLDTQANALGERTTKLELLLEHPDVLAASRSDIPFPSPVVTIVMPTWNRGWVVGAAIRSVQAQTFADWELVVVDDGSTDDTAAVMAAFHDPRIRYVTRTHAGQCRARNHALALARGALIAYLDSDNVWYPGYLAAAVAVFAAKPAVDCLYGAMVTDAHYEGEHILFRPFDRERLIDGNYIGMSTFMHRRALIERYGTFDEELSTLEDWDLILRYTAHAPAYRLPALAVRYRVVDTTRVSVTTQQQDAMARIRAKWQQA
jgi:hypothetical protein